MNEKINMENQEIESVSSNDIETMDNSNIEKTENIMEDSTVSQGDAFSAVNDIYSEQNVLTEYIPYDDTILIEKISDLNSNLLCIIFLIIVIWAESRIRNAVWRYFGHGKSD